MIVWECLWVRFSGRLLKFSTWAIPIFLARQSANGYVGLAMALPAGEKLPAGGREIAVISFTSLSPRPALTRAVEFADYPTRRELVDARANVAPAAFVMERAAIGRNRKHK